MTHQCKQNRSTGAVQFCTWPPFYDIINDSTHTQETHIQGELKLDQLSFSNTSNAGRQFMVLHSLLLEMYFKEIQCKTWKKSTCVCYFKSNHTFQSYTDAMLRSRVFQLPLVHITNTHGNRETSCKIKVMCPKGALKRWNEADVYLMHNSVCNVISRRSIWNSRYGILDCLFTVNDKTTYIQCIRGIF